MKGSKYISVLNRGCSRLFYQPAIKISEQQMEGGKSLYTMTAPHKKVFHFKEEMKTSNRKNLPDSQPVNQLIRTADWVRARGQIRPISDDPAPEENVGILFNIIRRRKNLSLERLASLTGYKIEELIAFEAGLLKRLRMCEMLPALAETVGVNQENWLQEFRTIKTRPLPQ